MKSEAAMGSQKTQEITTGTLRSLQTPKSMNKFLTESKKVESKKVRHAAPEQEIHWILRKIMEVWGGIGLEKPPEPVDLLSRIEANKWLRIFISVAIVGNIVCMGVEVNLEAPNVGKSTASSEALFYHLDMAFMAIYIVELSLKFWRHRLGFFYNADYAYNWLDLGLVLLGVMTFVQSATFEGTSSLRIMRLLRLTRLLRVVKLITAFRALSSIITSLMNTAGAMASFSTTTRTDSPLPLCDSSAGARRKELRDEPSI